MRLSGGRGPLGRGEIMRVRRSIVAAAAAVVLAATGGLVVPAVASAHNASHTLKFTAVRKKSVNFASGTFGGQETDVNSVGKIIGFDDVYFTITGTDTAMANMAVDVKGGFLYGVLTFIDAGMIISGKVTGGTGAFKGATGTIKAKQIGSTKTAVTVTYGG